MEEILNIDAAAFGGSGVGTLGNGKRCFVRGAVPGDVLKVRLLSDRKKFSVAEIVTIVRPSPSRIKPACPYFGACPGCSYLNMTYEEELRWKQVQFERFLVHSGLAHESAIRPPIGSPIRLGWRNKISFTCRDGVRGYLGEDNRTLLEIADCPLAKEKLRTLAANTPVPPEGEGKIVFRLSKEGPFIVTEENADMLVHEDVLGREMAVPAGSFFQINKECFDLLAQEFLSLLKDANPEVFAELYCGSGTFSMIAAAAGIRKIIGIEKDAASVRAAERNLQKVGTGKKKFIRGDASSMFFSIRNETSGNVLLLVDPPRTGLAPDLCQKINASPLRKMIYVSCGPDTLARDLQLLETGHNPWHVRAGRMVDLFPSTAHFETITLLER